jgi:Predicted membrane protein
VSNNPVYSFFATRGSFAPFFLRLALAAIFFYHGMQDVFGWFGGSGWNKTTTLWMSAEGYDLPYAVVVLLLVSEIAVCLALFFGLFTRLAALAVVTLGSVLIFVHGGTTFDAFETQILLMATGLSLMITGGGYLSMDRAISVNLLPQVG